MTWEKVVYPFQAKCRLCVEKAKVKVYGLVRVATPLPCICFFKESGHVWPSGGNAVFLAWTGQANKDQPQRNPAYSFQLSVQHSKRKLQHWQCFFFFSLKLQRFLLTFYWFWMLISNAWYPTKQLFLRGSREIYIWGVCGISSLTNPSFCDRFLVMIMTPFVQRNGHQLEFQLNNW